MPATQSVILFAISCAIIGLICAEVIVHNPCTDNDCHFHEVRVIPCTESEHDRPCIVSRRGPSYKMSFNYTPSFDADTLEQTLAWAKSETEDLPLVGAERDACKFTKCPIKSGEPNLYEMDVPIQKKFPINFYTVRWTIAAPHGKKCCFTHKIKIVR